MQLTLPSIDRAVTVLLACCLLQPVFAESAGQSGGPGWSEALPFYNRGNRYMNQGRFEDALHDYQQAVAKCTTDSDFYVNLGTAYQKISDYGNAQAAFEKAISLNKEDWSAWNNLANSYIKQNKYVDAVRSFEEALKRNPPDADKEAIKKDIVDIKKILTAQGVSVDFQATPLPATVPKTASRPANLHSVKNKPVPSEPAARQQELPSKAPKSSDWGY